MAADGSIIIDTRIDQKGINTGVKTMSASLGKVLNVVKGIGKALAAAFIGGSILNSIRGMLGSFDLMKSSIANTIKPLSDALGNLKGAFVNLILTAFVPLIPHIVTFVQWLTNMLFIVTQVIAALFGMKKTIGGVASETKKATKETKGALAAFDQINILQKQQEGEEQVPFITPEAITVSQEIQEFVDKILHTIENIKKIFDTLFDNPLLLLKLLEGAWKAFVEWVRNNLPFGNLIADILTIVGETFKNLFVNVIETILKVKENILLVFQGIKDFLTGVFTGDWELAWQGLKEIVAGVFGAIRAIVEGVIKHFLILFLGFRDILKVIFAPIADALRTAFGTALEWIRERFSNVFEGIKNFAKGVINSIIGFINEMIQTIASAINFIVNSFNAIGSLSPGFSPISNVTAPQIPRLATGAVIPPNAQFAAILGDQRSGTNIEAPTDLIRQIFREELGNIQANIEIGFTGSLGALVRELKPVLDKEDIRVGNSLVKGVRR